MIETPDPFVISQFNNHNQLANELENIMTPVKGILLFYTLVFLGMALTVTAVNAQVVCGPRESIIGKLGEAFGEQRQALGISGDAVVIELYVSAKGTWTMVSTTTKGISCLIGAGQAWQDMEPILTGEDT